MRKPNMGLRFTMALAVLALAGSTIANAQATRTWVSGVGDDANPCSRTAPCKTFAGAISKTAPGGEIDVLDPGGFGAVTITKSISIEADGVIAGVLVSGTNGIVICAGANDNVVIRGLTIEGLGTGLAGILVSSNAGCTVGGLFVENTVINHFTGKGIDFEPTTASTLHVQDSTIRNNAGGGVLVKPTSGTTHASLERVRLERNQFGLRAEDNSIVSVRDVVAANNTSNGFFAFSNSAAVTIDIDSSVSSGNGNGGVDVHNPNATIRLARTTLTHNGASIVFETANGTVAGYSNNQVFGNGTDTLPNATLVQH